MTELDASIPLQIRPPQFDNPMDIQARSLQLRNLGLQGQSQQIALEQNQRTLQDQKTIADLYRANTQPDGSVDHSGVVQGLANAGLGDKIPAYQEQVAKASKASTDDQSAQFDLQQKKLTDVDNRISSLLGKPNLTRQDVIDQVNQLTDHHSLDPQTRDQMLATIPQNPLYLKDFLVKKGLETQNFSQQLASRASMSPQLEKIDTGSGINLAKRDPQTGEVTMGQTVAKGLSPDTAANISKDYAVAGLNPDGTPGQANAALVKMIGEGRMIPSDRLESTPRGQAVLAEVEKQYPGYDVTTARAKQKAAYDFGPGGKDGTALRSIGTVAKHLDMLDGLVSALDNGNTPLFNKLANTVGAATGSTAPGNFDAAKEIVGKEVVKAIVAGGGGVSEREEASKALSSAKTPAQLRGVIATYKTIMGAQHESLLQQRDAAGLSRSTLPDYTEGGAVPPDIAAILAKHGTPK